MSVRVNLLPREFEARNRQRQAAALGVVAVLAFAGFLAFLLLGRLSAVDSATDDRDAAQQEVTDLTSRVAALQPFQDLANRLAAGNLQLAFAMGDEVSWAALLNDVALTTPTSTSLTGFTGQLVTPQPNQPQNEVFSPNDAADAGVLTFNGYSVDRFAPGIEAVLLRYGTVESFYQEYLSIATDAQISGVGVIAFNAEVRLDEDARTLRYVDGLPEGGR